MFQLANFMLHPKSTMQGVLVGILTGGLSLLVHAIGAAMTAAAHQYATTGNTTDWTPYATAAIAAAAPVIYGGLKQDVPKLLEGIAPAVQQSSVQDAVNQAAVTYLSQAVDTHLGTSQPALAKAITTALASRTDTTANITTP